MHPNKLGPHCCPHTAPRDLRENQLLQSWSHLQCGRPHWSCRSLASHRRGHHPHLHNLSQLVWKALVTLNWNWNWPFVPPGGSMEKTQRSRKSFRFCSLMSSSVTWKSAGGKQLSTSWIAYDIIWHNVANMLKSNNAARTWHVMESALPWKMVHLSRHIRSSVAEHSKTTQTEATSLCKVLLTIPDCSTWLMFIVQVQSANYSPLLSKLQNDLGFCLQLTRISHKSVESTAR